MRSSKILPTVFFISLFLCPILAAQEIPPPPIEWGEIEKSDLEMKVFSKDTNASAVILCDYGDTKLNDSFELIFKRHLRVKILNHNGFKWGTHAITLWVDKDNGDDIDDIEGTTYVLDAGGNIIEHEFDDDDVFEEELEEDRRRYKFTLPGLAPGCIIEVRYTIRSRSLRSVRNWKFQHDEPVLWSEYRLLHPTPIAYAIVTKGLESFTVRDRFELKQYYSGQVAGYYGDKIVNCYFSRWALKDIPALRDEPYTTTLDDYYSKVEIQLAGYALRGGGVQRELSTWEELIKELDENRYIGKFIDETGDVEDLVESVTKNLTSPESKVGAIYDWITNSIVWNGDETMWTDVPINTVLESKKGNSAEINYLLVAMLRAAGFKAEPIVLSTRENGLLQDLYPMTRQFNYGMARVFLNYRHLYLDATSPLRPMTLLPSKVLGVRALVIQENNVEWVTLQSPAKGVSIYVSNITLGKHGTMNGTIDGTFKDYANVNIRSSLKTKKSIEVAKSNLSVDASGIVIDSVTVVNGDSLIKPISLKTWISSDSYVQSGGDLLYLNPHIVSRWKDNPFKSPKRKFPVDYNYPQEYKSIVHIALPDSYEVKESLKDVRFSVNGVVTYSRKMIIENQRLQLHTAFEILTKDVPALQYDRLRELYASMIQVESEQIVLQQIRPAPAPPPVPAATEPPAEKSPVKQTKKKKK